MHPDLQLCFEGMARAIACLDRNRLALHTCKPDRINYHAGLIAGWAQSLEKWRQHYHDELARHHRH